MASVSASHLILFIAAVVICGAFAGVMVQSSTQIGNAIEDSSKSRTDRINTVITIVSDARSPRAVYNNTTNVLTLYVKNIGFDSIPYRADAVTVLVNGNYQTSIRTIVLGPENEWRPGNLLRIRTNVSLPSNASTRIAVAVSGGQDYFTFTTA